MAQLLKIDKIQIVEILENNVEVYIGFGSNQGDREQTITNAIKSLSLVLGNPLRVSSIVETEPWGFVSANSFLNAIAIFSTNIAPLDLLDTTESIERSLGRKTKSDNNIYKDRPIDIDILFYGKEIISEKRLTIPHPKIHERQFILDSLMETAPRLVHPVLGKSIEELAQELEKKNKATHP